MPQAIHWQQAAYWCNQNMPGFEMLTTPMQGMLVGAYMDLYGTDNEWKIVPDYESTLRLVDEVYSMHGREGWGYEK